MPPDPYKTTAVFTKDTVPAGLLKAHNLKAGAWGLLVVEAGELLYILDETGIITALRATDTALIKPLERHHVELSDDAAFRIHFYTQNPEEENICLTCG